MISLQGLASWDSPDSLGIVSLGRKGIMGFSFADRLPQAVLRLWKLAKPLVE